MIYFINSLYYIILFLIYTYLEILYYFILYKYKAFSPWIKQLLLNWKTQKDLNFLTKECLLNTIKEYYSHNTIINKLLFRYEHIVLKVYVCLGSFNLLSSPMYLCCRPEFDSSIFNFRILVSFLTANWRGNVRW